MASHAPHDLTDSDPMWAKVCSEYRNALDVYNSEMVKSEQLRLDRIDSLLKRDQAERTMTAISIAEEIFSAYEGRAEKETDTFDYITRHPHITQEERSSIMHSVLSPHANVWHFVPVWNSPKTHLRVCICVTTQCSAHQA